VSRPSPTLLIVNADDLGMSAGINRAIFEGHARGIVTSASLLAGGALFDEAVEELAQHPRLGVGVHLCLHEERPVLPPERIPSLVGEDGKLRPLGAVLKQAVTGRLPADEVEAELSAQVERVRQAGVEIDHFDSHCHVHAFPSIARVVRRVADRHGVRRIRRTEAARWSDFTGAPPGRFLVSSAITLCSRLSRGRIGRDIRTTDRFFGLVHSGSGETSWIPRAIRALQPGRSAELMVHPGDGTDAAGPSDDHGPEKRLAEFEAVTSGAVRELLDERGVELVPWSRLPA